MGYQLPAPDSLAQYKERVLNLCALHSCSTTSGIRTPARYRKIVEAAGKPYHQTSKHLLSMGGWADDLVLDDPSVENRTALLVAARFLGLYAVDEGDHIHVQGKPPGGGG